MPAWIVLLAVVSGVLGATTAFYFYRAFVFLRRELLMLVVILGWIFSTLVLCGVISGGLIYFSARSDPRMYIAPALGVLALLLAAALIGYGAIAVKQKRAFGLSWTKTFGALMAEVGTAVLVASIAQNTVYPLADVLRASDRNIPHILASFAQARYLIGYFSGALCLALLMLQIFGLPRRLQHCFHTQQNDDDDLVSPGETGKSSALSE